MKPSPVTTLPEAVCRILDRFPKCIVMGTDATLDRYRVSPAVTRLLFDAIDRGYFDIRTMPYLEEGQIVAYGCQRDGTTMEPAWLSVGKTLGLGTVYVGPVQLANEFDAARLVSNSGPHHT